MPKMKPDDLAYWMLHDGFESVPVTYNPSCYICNDPEFAQMGLPLCRKCIICGSHIPADNCVCDNGHLEPDNPYDEFVIRITHKLPVSYDLYQKAKLMILGMLK